MPSYHFDSPKKAEFHWFGFILLCYSLSNISPELPISKKTVQMCFQDGKDIFQSVPHIFELSNISIYVGVAKKWDGRLPSCPYLPGTTCPSASGNFKAPPAAGPSFLRCMDEAQLFGGFLKQGHPEIIQFIGFSTVNRPFYSILGYLIYLHFRKPLSNDHNIHHRSFIGKRAQTVWGLGSQCTRDKQQ